MSFRETLGQNAFVSKVVAVLFILLCALVIARELKGPALPQNAVGKGFYSDDDGRTWFVADEMAGSPIEHNGKQAYRAIVYRCPDGKPFVAYLAKYSDAQQAQISSDAAKHPGQPSEAQLGPLRSIKKPGETKWSDNSSPSITGYPAVHCPDGSGAATIVVPSDPDSGAAS